MDHDSVVKEWQQNAQSHDGENYEFLRSMKFQDYGFDPDELAGELHRQAFQIVDCTRCANCCKTMDIVFSDEDVERIAGHLEMANSDFIETYLEANKEDGPYKARQKPCPFLGEDDRSKSMMCGRRSAENTRTRTRRILPSERWALPAMHRFAPLCSGLSSR